MTPAPTVSGGGRRRVRTLDEVLELQRRRDVVGREPAGALRAHSAGYAVALGATPDIVVDLGSGGGVPGLVLAVERWPAARITLLDASQRRCTYLELCVADLDLGDRLDVLWARAEETGRDPARRGAADAVVARSFGPPAATAECAAPLLRPGGALVVSEPPGGAGDRWDADGLGQLGLVLETTEVVEGATFTRLRQVEPCPDAFPRRPGVPARRPLF
ncbi:MAG TPA: RsmG family class I SAM-dependent methyltransferase [Iamia sp.]|nr:RsmG family class I SAM-dependent methyltransferase [Iamia sp.]